MSGALRQRLRALAGPRLTAFVGGLVAAGMIGAIGGLFIVETGSFNTTAISPHSPEIAWATHTTMIHAVQRNARSIRAPASFSKAQVVAGLRDYDASCVVCHGGPAIDRANWVAGLTPSPPFLMDAARHWSASQMFWIVKNGVKMTAMPAWGLTRSDAQVWNLVAFLEAAPAMSPADYARLKGPTTPAPR